MAFRGGRGGRGGGAGGNLRSNIAGLDVSDDMLDQLRQFEDGQREAEAKAAKNQVPPGQEQLAATLGKDRMAFIWPEHPDLPLPVPLTDRERRIARMASENLEWMRNSVFWTGDPGDNPPRSKRGRDDENADYDAFNDVDTYGKKFKKKKFVLPDLKTHKFANPGVSHPKELWSTIGYNPDTWEQDREKRKDPFATYQKKRDPLAFLNDEEDDDEKGDDAENENEVNEEDEDDEQERDTDFEEDEEDDLDNDYNAEQHFDNGEDDFEEQGAEDFADHDG